MQKNIVILTAMIMVVACKTEFKKEENMKINPDKQVVIDSLMNRYGENEKFRIERGVEQVASLWTTEDGTDEEFKKFCLDNFIESGAKLKTVFDKISRNLEILNGHFNTISLELLKPIHLDMGTIHEVDQMFGSYSAGAHLDNDFYQNKIAFYIALNFPHYTLGEKNELGKDWNSLQWAYARMGDIYTARVPAKYLQEYARVSTAADMYISEYNIYAGELLDPRGEKIFPKGLKLLSHWNIRDEIKSNYGVETGLNKQRLLYEVMVKIIRQEIPEMIINSEEYQYSPYENKVYKDGEEVKFVPGDNTRYQHLLNSFHALKAMDPFHPELDTYIKRKFDGEMEMPQPWVEDLFVDFLSSPRVKDVAGLISRRLKRDLEPFDIWYDGFKARTGINEEELDNITMAKYPSCEEYEEDMPDILMKLGFSEQKAKEIASRITVEAARGSGHAWGAAMKSADSYLRTRVTSKGMDYKGYNIATHEFGHTVEQTISLHDVDYYMINGVPNTSFTEALAFMFQHRDLDLLNIETGGDERKYLRSLDKFWSVYEIMGVSLVDMNVWKWLYDNPNATAGELKEAVLSISREIWNKYYADILGGQDSEILAIYSHMISYPLYLSAYSFGQIIDFQIEQYILDKNFAREVQRMFSLGRLTPDVWMDRAVGEPVSVEPMLKAVGEAIEYF
ncbi:MAG: hypothetical protein ACLFUC_10220 [Bacteroidales bacterium]